jgi:hypothetical protein
MRRLRLIYVPRVCFLSLSRRPTDGKPVWFFTATDGSLQQVPKVSNADILDRLGNPNSPGALVAVCKRPATDRTGNDVELMSSVELEELLNNPGVRKGLVCLQRYVKPKGTRASFIRAAWCAPNPQTPKSDPLSNFSPVSVCVCYFSVKI